MASYDLCNGRWNVLVAAGQKIDPKKWGLDTFIHVPCADSSVRFRPAGKNGAQDQSQAQVTTTRGTATVRQLWAATRKKKKSSNNNKTTNNKTNNHHDDDDDDDLQRRPQWRRQEQEKHNRKGGRVIFFQVHTKPIVRRNKQQGQP